jgi:MFS family permease
MRPSDAPIPAWAEFPLLRQFFESAYSRADRLFDRGQRQVFRLLWFFLPDTSIANDLRFQQVMASRYLSDAGQQALAYGALIATARNGGSTFDLAIIGSAALIPPALFGLYGGAVADELPKRVALAFIYFLQAVFCFIVPSFAGTSLTAVFVLIFAVNTLGQVSGPTESSVVAVVASDEQLASAASLIHLSSSLGAALGTAILAPILVRVLGVEPVMYVAGVLLVLAGTRVIDLHGNEPDRPIRFVVPNISVRPALRWLAEQPAVSTMIFVGVLSGVANVVLQTLAPSYVISTLHVDATNTVYVFAPSSAGLLLALSIAPTLMRRWGERLTALSGFLVTGVVLLMLGTIDNMTSVIDPFNPVRLASLIGIEINAHLRTASLLAVPLGFGFSLTTTCVQTYVNRRVPLALQGRAFALQSTLKNGLAIIPLLSLGAIAAKYGVQPILIAAPFVLLVLAYALVQTSIRFAGFAHPSRLEVMSTYWNEKADRAGNPR